MKAKRLAKCFPIGFHGMVYSNDFTLDRNSPYAF
jgi:hypothetical protein